jgi:cbb3-type cytochrome oxidase subunit 3
VFIVNLTFLLDFLAVGVVILISIAIAAGVVFLLVLLGILWTLFARRDNKKVDYAMYDDDVSSEHNRPSSLLEHINAATRTTILGGTSPFADPGEKQEAYGAAGYSQDHDGDHFHRAETPSDAMHLGMAAEESGRPAHARYSFDGGGEGELPLYEGMGLEVLDDRDPK